jgi:predicted nucleic acid-binding protein
VTRRLFLDTSGWAAAVNPRDQHHAAAVGFYRGARERRLSFLTTNLVIAEAHALIGRRLGDAIALRVVEQLRIDPAHEVAWSTSELERDAVDRWLRPRVGQGISLADAVSFEIMRREGIRTAFTFDADFAAAGFEVAP